jgi:hypothetical protein
MFERKEQKGLVYGMTISQMESFGKAIDWKWSAFGNFQGTPAEVRDLLVHLDKLTQTDQVVTPPQDLVEQPPDNFAQNYLPVLTGFDVGILDPSKSDRKIEFLSVLRGSVGYVLHVLWAYLNWRGDSNVWVHKRIKWLQRHRDTYMFDLWFTTNELNVFRACPYRIINAFLEGYLTGPVAPLNVAFIFSTLELLIGGVKKSPEKTKALALLKERRFKRKHRNACRLALLASSDE